MTHEQVIRKALEERKDPHTVWAAHCFAKKEEDVTREERAQAKAENFCLLYSGSFMATVNWPQELQQGN